MSYRPRVATYTNLLSPGRIGSLEVRNRILMCPMGDNLPEADGQVGERQGAYFEERARGGAGLLLVGATSVAYPNGSFTPNQVAASDDRYLPGLTALAARVHRHGARIAAQLLHQGQLSLLDIARGQPLLVPAAPSPSESDRWSAMVTPSEGQKMLSTFAEPGAKVEFREATDDDLAWVIECFASAAARCVEAGFDGIELHAGHGYLLDEFLTPSMNTRTDRWGGDVEGRSRLLREVVRAVRARIGDVPVWMRINAVEHHKTNGETFEDQLEVIERTVAEGLAAVHLTAYHHGGVSTGPTDSYVPHVVGPLADYAAEVRRRVDVPVITFGRFEPAEAEEVLASGKADFVAMGRKLLADPDLPRKLAEGAEADVRPCIYQYRCIGNIFVKEPLACVANARTGREHELPEGPAATPRRVLVVGAGAGGLEAARVLAGDGHHVTVWEAASEAGGALRLAAATDASMAAYLAWLERQVDQFGIRIELGRAAGIDDVVAGGWDEVVVATGARWPVEAGSVALSAGLALEQGRVSIRGGDIPGVRLAGMLAGRGLDVELVEPSGVFAAALGLPGRWRLVPDLDAAGVQLVTEPAGDADVVVAADPGPPDDDLAAALRGAGVAVTAVGDANGDGRRWIEGANLDVAQLAARLKH